MPVRSDAYTLIVRQGPERAKAFAGPREKGTVPHPANPAFWWGSCTLTEVTLLKDRKPVDPPPIVQLRIRDPDDPAQ